jgi:glycosyltransferase involved in cell wall biosynthesis
MEPKHRVIFQIIASPFTHQSRLERMIESSLESGVCDRVHVAALPAEGLPDEELRNDGRVSVSRKALRIPRRVPGPLRHPFQYLSWLLAMGRRASQLRPILVQATSVETLPAAVLLKAWLRVPVIYDAAELEREKFPGRPLAKRIADIVERFFLPFVAETCVVSESIADWYEAHRRGARPSLVRNVPRRAVQLPAPSGALRRRLGLGESDLVFLYQGGLAPGRGIEALVDASRHLPEGRNVVFLGYGPLRELVERAARDARSIHFVPAVSPSELPSLTADADLGIVLYEDVCLNHRYCLPNKLFEFYLAGLPVLASDLIEMRRFIERHDAGYVIRPEADAIRRFLASVDGAELRRRRARALPADAPAWETEERPYLDMLNRALLRANRADRRDTEASARPQEAR